MNDNLFAIRCRIPKKCRNASFDKIEAGESKDVVGTYLDELNSMVNDGISLLFHGLYSTGKTSAACVILHALEDIRLFGLFMTAEELPGLLIGDNMFSETESWRSRIETIPLLVIDELQIHAKVDYRIGCIENIVRTRVNEMKSTILTTNHKIEDIRESMPGLYEVMQEAFLPVFFGGTNMRKEKALQIRQRFGKA